MDRRIPVLATLLVLAAVGIMIRLGFWQLDRLHQKEALLARYTQASGMPLADLSDRPAKEDWLYRRVWVLCRTAGPWQAIAGHNLQGKTGWAHVARCAPAETFRRGVDVTIRGPVDIVAGWSSDLREPDWQGGSATGVLVPGPGHTVRVVADEPLGNLDRNARPDPRDIPNNHLAYAVQWFLFAATALVIYALALCKRLQK